MYHSYLHCISSPLRCNLFSRFFPHNLSKLSLSTKTKISINTTHTYSFIWFTLHFDSVVLAFHLDIFNSLSSRFSLVPFETFVVAFYTFSCFSFSTSAIYMHDLVGPVWPFRTCMTLCASSAFAIITVITFHHNVFPFIFLPLFPTHHIICPWNPILDAS